MRRKTFVFLVWVSCLAALAASSAAGEKASPDTLAESSSSAVVKLAADAPPSQQPAGSAASSGAQASSGQDSAPQLEPAQKPTPPAAAGAQQSGATGEKTPWTPPTTEAEQLAQMRADLAQMESLLNNMSSEITFLRDQNLQILLNTNARMWTMLIRDLRAQIELSEKRVQTTKAHEEESRPKH